MKKGFTLIELLIVMVIVAILVTVSVPKYRAAMERTRGLEAVTNLKMMGDFLNALYVKQENSYCPGGSCAVGELQQYTQDADKVRSTFFYEFALADVSFNLVKGSITRMGGLYTLYLKAQNGSEVVMCCGGNDRYCRALGGENTANCTTAEGLELVF